MMSYLKDMWVEFAVMATMACLYAGILAVLANW